MNMIFNKEALLVVALVLLAAACILYCKRHKPIEKEDEDIVVEVLHHFKTWNEQITTKQGMFDFYSQLNELFREVWNVKFKVQLTKQEFDQMALNAIKQLNAQALDEIINQLSSKPK